MAFAETAVANERMLVVGTRAGPPFAMQDASFVWQGIAIGLWREVARELAVEFSLEQRALPSDLIDGVADGTLDLAVAALTITSDREAVVDFSHPFFNTGLAIAVPQAPSGDAWREVLDRLLSAGFLKIVGILSLLLLGVGCIVWLAERRANPEQFERSPMAGIASGFWWAAVTMTTVGYGDKSPRSVIGRLLGLVWMFSGIVLISVFTAHITTSLTVSSLSGPVAGLQDLARSRVGVVAATATGRYLADYRIGVIDYDELGGALRALANLEIDAVVHDDAILRYAVRDAFAERLRVLDGTFAHQQYGIAMPQDSPLREQLNRAILRVIESDAWTELVVGYTGSPPN